MNVNYGWVVSQSKIMRFVRFLFCERRLEESKKWDLIPREITLPPNLE